MQGCPKREQRSKMYGGIGVRARAPRLRKLSNVNNNIKEVAWNVHRLKGEFTLKKLHRFGKSVEEKRLPTELKIFLY